jgi:cobalt/nickel transport system ATP-binding protein
MKQQEAVIRLDQVCYAYDEIVALRYITMQAVRGECVVLWGPNGCGKSTLLKLLNGLIFPQEGSYHFFGKEINAQTLKDTAFEKWFHQKIGFIFQDADVQLFCSNVQEEIAFGPSHMGLSPEEVDRRTGDILRLLDIEHLKDRAPYHLSGGEKRKVSIGCILSMNPEVLVLDEPLAGLDQKSQIWLTAFLKDLKTAGKTLVLSTHNEALAHSMADRILYMNEDHSLSE